jgi:hypothetical protein
MALLEVHSILPAWQHPPSLRFLNEAKPSLHTSLRFLDEAKQAKHIILQEAKKYYVANKDLFLIESESKSLKQYEDRICDCRSTSNQAGFFEFEMFSRAWPDIQFRILGQQLPGGHRTQTENWTGKWVVFPIWSGAHYDVLCEEKKGEDKQCCFPGSIATSVQTKGQVIMKESSEYLAFSTESLVLAVRTLNVVPTLPSHSHEEAIISRQVTILGIFCFCFLSSSIIVGGNREHSTRHRMWTIFFRVSC